MGKGSQPCTAMGMPSIKPFFHLSPIKHRCPRLVPVVLLRSTLVYTVLTTQKSLSPSCVSITLSFPSPPLWLLSVTSVIALVVTITKSQNALMLPFNCISASAELAGLSTMLEELRTFLLATPQELLTNLCVDRGACGKFNSPGEHVSFDIC